MLLWILSKPTWIFNPGSHFSIICKSASWANPSFKISSLMNTFVPKWLHSFLVSGISFNEITSTRKTCERVDNWIRQISLLPMNFGFHSESNATISSCRRVSNIFQNSSAESTITSCESSSFKVCNFSDLFELGFAGGRSTVAPLK